MPHRIWKCFGNDSKKCEKKKWPRLNTIVVQQGSGHAGDGVIGDPALDPPAVFAFSWDKKQNISIPSEIDTKAALSRLFTIRLLS